MSKKKYKVSKEIERIKINAEISRRIKDEDRGCKVSD